MDLSMPVMDGLEATRQMRNLPLPRDRVPRIVAMTADVLESDKNLCREAGMDDYLPKPLKVAELVDMLESGGYAMLKTA